MLQRRILARKDTQDRRDKISAARHIIYEQHFVVDTSQVEALLKEESLVPTKVGNLFCVTCTTHAASFV